MCTIHTDDLRPSKYSFSYAPFIPPPLKSLLLRSRVRAHPRAQPPGPSPTSQASLNLHLGSSRTGSPTSRFGVQQILSAPHLIRTEVLLSLSLKETPWAFTPAIRRSITCQCCYFLSLFKLLEIWLICRFRHLYLLAS